MKRIFKYTFLQRKHSILLSCALMACMSGVELLFLILTTDGTNSFYHLWFILTLLALVVIPLSLFIRCSSGYARSLLFTDESYLMLTLPVHTKEILLGRMLCGLTELLIYATTSILLISVVIPFWAIYYRSIEVQDFFQLVGQFVNTILAKNIPGLIVLLVLFLTAFILIGNVTLTVQTILRSFNIKRMRALWTVGSILLFMSTLSTIGAIESKAAALFGDYCSIPVNGIYYYHDGHRIVYSVAHVPVVSIILAIALGIGCFFLSIWLLKKKVEV